jgi:hypothetical protein
VCVMDWGNVPDWVSAIASCGLLITAIIAAFIGFKNLKSWRAETIGRRKAELAEQVLAAIYEVKEVFIFVRSSFILEGEGQSRQPELNESEKVKAIRDRYVIPIERLRREKAVFARLQSQGYALQAMFGAESIEPLRIIREVRGSIESAADVLIQTAIFEDVPKNTFKDKDELLAILGWGKRQRPDETDKKIDKAVQDMEAICRPILSGAVPS